MLVLIYTERDSTLRASTTQKFRQSTTSIFSSTSEGKNLLTTTRTAGSPRSGESLAAFSLKLLPQVHRLHYECAHRRGAANLFVHRRGVSVDETAAANSLPHSGYRSAAGGRSGEGAGGTNDHAESAQVSSYNKVCC